MPNPNHHKDCPRCKGEGFYLRREEGYFRDGSYSPNDWQDCECYPEMKVENLPQAVDPRRLK